MILIAGITPKTETIDDTPRLCPRCGLAQAYLQRVDHFFSLFFIPLFRVKTGQPFLMCRRCQKAVGDIPYASDSAPALVGPDCRECGRPLQEGFAYCPYCGTPVSDPVRRQGNDP